MVIRLVFLVGLFISLPGCTQTVGVSSPLPVGTVYLPPEQSPSVAAAPPAPAPAPEQIFESHKNKAAKVEAMQATISNNARAYKKSEPPSKSTTEIAGLIPGSAAYQIPTTMIENESSPVDLWIDTSMTREEISQKLDNFLKENAERAANRTGKVKSKAIGTTQIVGKDVVVGKKMYAELTGPDFEIQPSGSQELAYIPGRTLTWHWLVKPTHASETGLPLAISVQADPGEGKTPEPTIQEVVIVHARKKTPREIFEELDWWIKLFGGGGIGAAGLWIANRFISRRRINT